MQYLLAIEKRICQGKTNEIRLEFQINENKDIILLKYYQKLIDYHNKLSERLVRLLINFYTKCKLDYNHYLVAIEHNSALYTLSNFWVFYLSSILILIDK